MADLKLEWPPKTRALGLRLVSYVLLSALALDVLDLFLRQPLSSVAVNVAAGAMLLIALFLYIPWQTAFDTKATERRLASQAAGIDASIHTLNRMAEDMSSGTQREVASLEAAVTRMAASVDALGKAVPGLEKKVSQIEEEFDGLGGRLASLQEEAAVSRKSLAKMGSADSEFQTRMDEVRELTAAIGSSVERVARTLAEMGSTEAQVQSRVKGLEKGVARFDGSLDRLSEKLALVERSAVEVNRKTDSLGRRSLAIESRVSAVARNQAEIVVTGRRVARIERNIAKLARGGRTEARSRPKAEGKAKRRRVHGNASRRKAKQEQAAPVPPRPSSQEVGASPPLSGPESTGAN